MFKVLHTVYRYAPGPARKLLVRLSPLVRFVLSPLISRVNIGSATMFIDSGDNACFRYLKWGADYERITVSALRTLANRPGNKVFFDAGAAYGFYSLSLATTVPADRLGQVFAFEPDRRCVNALQKSVQYNHLENRVFVEHAIVGDTEGTADLLISDRASTSNRTFQTDEGVFTTSRTISVRATSIDASFKPSHEDFIALFKIDVEGNEARVLRGAREILGKARGWAIQFEFYPIGMLEVHQSRSELMDICKQLEPDWVYVERDTHLERLDGIKGLFADMATHSDHPDYRGIGTAANYLIGRGLPEI